MTQQTPEQQAAPIQVAPVAGSKLAELHARYAALKAEADEAAARLKACTDGIKAELAAAAPEQPRVELIGSAGPALRMTYTETWRFDSTRFKREDPETYVRFAKKTGSWSLKAAPAGGEG